MNQNQNCRNLDQDLHGVRSILKVMQCFPFHSRVNIEMYALSLRTIISGLMRQRRPTQFVFSFFLSHTRRLEGQVHSSLRWSSRSTEGARCRVRLRFATRSAAICILNADHYYCYARLRQLLRRSVRSLPDELWNSTDGQLDLEN